MHRRALRARLLSFPGWDLLRIDFCTPRLGAVENKVMAGGTPANPANPAREFTRSLARPELLPSASCLRRR
jgi:hypothetical protein